MYAAMTKDEGNAADACLPVGRGVFQQPVSEEKQRAHPVRICQNNDRWRQLRVWKRQLF
jgi:hypothetical protein